MGFQLADVDPAKRAFSLLDEFKTFAFKGNVIDLAVGVIIGGAFGRIIDALVKKVIMPLVGALTGGGPDGTAEWAKKLSTKVNGVDIPYGEFLGELVSFLIIALILFIVIVKVLGWVLSLRKKEAAAPPPPPADVALLTEIRDLLKQQLAKPSP
jgi:large conductance mechanosensitive channel